MNTTPRCGMTSGNYKKRNLSSTFNLSFTLSTMTLAVRMKTVCESLDYKTSTKLPCLHNVHSIYNTPKEKTLLALIIGRLFSKFYWAVLAVLNSHALLLAIVLKIRWCSVVNTANDDTVTEIRTDFQRSSKNDFSSPLKWSISPSVPVVTLIH